jgi:small subunit ribosomal protein S27Ae
MRIQVKTLTGKSSTFVVEESTSINELRNMIQDVLSVPSDEQKLIFNGKLMEEGTCSDFNLMEEAAIHMLVALEGGKGKKKKKVVKKAKKKHKKKKVKMAVVKYFKVEGEKVVRLRERSKTGTFLADLKDRLYCGRSCEAFKKK